MTKRTSCLGNRETKDLTRFLISDLKEERIQELTKMEDENFVNFQDNPTMG